MFLRVLFGSALFITTLAAAAPNPIPNMTVPPKAGKVDLYPEKDLKPGMQAVAWTVFQGSKPEPVPVEIVGIWENAWGPKQDIIIGKMGGKAIRTNVAGGMSGSPVYIDGKLVGAISLRLSVFSPDAICGITPIRLMLEVNDFDQSKPANSMAPGTVAARRVFHVSARWPRPTRHGRRLRKKLRRNSNDDAHRHAHLHVRLYR